ncbi:MAG: restriction endonuclease [Bryobacteraceae bacterium]
MNQPKWKKFEELVAMIQADLAGDAVVTHNDTIIGKKTGARRQIDVSIRKNVGQFDLLIVIECKDYGRPLDVGDIEEFMGLAQDVGAHKAGMVAAKGFAETAKKRAKEAGIELYSVADTEDHDWKSIIEIPAVIEFTGVTKFSLSFSAAGDEPFVPPDATDLKALILFDEQERALGMVRDLIGQKWNAGEIPEQPGEYRDVEFAPNPSKFKSGGKFYKARITAKVLVETRRRFGYWSVSKMSGFHDERTGATVTRHLEFDYLSMIEVERNWPRINSVGELAVHPVIILKALDHWSPDDPI